MAKIAMIVFSSYPLDVRVRREAEALYEAKNSVDVFCRTSRNEAARELVNGILTYRITLSRKRVGKLNYFYEYLYFFIWAFFKLTINFIKKRYDVVHIHNMPDFLVFTALIPKLSGSKIILDLHDPMPELYTAMFNIKPKNYIIKVLRFFEKISIGFAHHVLTPNIAFKKLFISRSCPSEKISIIMNSPDEKIFNPELANTLSYKNDNNFIMMYHGAVVERHGLDLAVKAVASLKEQIPGLKFKIYGDGNFLPEIKKLISELKIENMVDTFGLVIVDKIAAAIPSIDLGIIPNRLNDFTQINFPVRIFEYLVMNKPVIVPKTQGIKDYFNDDSIFYFESGNSEDLGKKILEVYQNEKYRMDTLNKSILVFNNFRWEKQKKMLISIYKQLIDNGKVTII